MPAKWSARALTGALTIVFLTQPGFAAESANRPVSKAVTTAPGAASRQKLDAIKERGEHVAAGVRLKYEDRLASLAGQVDLEARSNAPGVAGRLANEFGMKAAALASEHSRTGGGWGDLMIAHMLRSNTRFTITSKQVYDLHRDGMAWTMVAHGLGLDIAQFVTAVEAESRVAIGESKADGKVPAIGRADAGNTSVNIEP